MFANLIVGTGPIGVAAAAALLGNDEDVYIIDGGITIEQELLARITALASRAPESWRAHELEFLKRGVRLSKGEIDTKLIYGSDYCYRWSDPTAEYESRQVPKVRNSFAPGGLSQVWGAGILSFSEDDLKGWPVRLEELTSHYAAVLGLLPYAAAWDRLANIHPLYADTLPPLRLSSASESFLKDTEGRAANLEAEGITIGRARLAVNTADCRYCGLCLYGCPYGLIWNSIHALQKLAPRYGTRLRYESGWIVDDLKEQSGECVEVRLSTPDGADRRTIKAQRVFLAAGVIQTSKILLKSLGLYDRPVRLKDSQYFLVPFLRWRASAKVLDERLATLAQLFLEIRNPQVSARPVLFSIYSYNDQVQAMLQQRLRLLGPLSSFAVRQLAERLLIFAGYLHSEESSSLNLSLERSEAGKSKLVLQSDLNPSVSKSVKRILRFLMRNAMKLGGIPLSPLLRIMDPGTSYHYGGSFPMSLEPRSAFESDRWGRPRGLARTFIVDASNFPTMPASNLTVNAMANAHRIATAALRELP